MLANVLSSPVPIVTRGSGVFVSGFSLTRGLTKLDDGLAVAAPAFVGTSGSGGFSFFRLHPHCRGPDLVRFRRGSIITADEPPFCPEQALGGMGVFVFSLASALVDAIFDCVAERLHARWKTRFRVGAGFFVPGWDCLVDIDSGKSHLPPRNRPAVG
jgi:hypothetical protein